MMQEDPRQRPSVDEVVAHFDEIRRALPRSRLRSRIVWGNEDSRERASRNFTEKLRLVWDYLPIPGHK